MPGVLLELDKDGFLFVFEKWTERLDKCIRLGVTMWKKSIRNIVN